MASRGGGGHGGGGGKRGAANAAEVRAELGLRAGTATYREMATILRPYFWPSGRKERLLALLCFALLGLSKIANIASPIFLGIATDELLRGKWPWGSLLLFGCLRFLVSLFEEGQRLVYLRVKEVAYRQIAVKTFGHLLSLSLAWHVNKKLGIVLRATERGVSSANTIVEMLVLRLVPTIVEMFATATLFGALYGSPNSAVILIASFVLYFIATYLLTGVRTKLRSAQNAAENDAAQVAADVLGSFETVASWSTEKRELARYSTAVATQQALSRSSQAAAVALNLAQTFIQRLSLVGVLIVASADVLGGRTSVGAFVALSTWMVQLFAPLNWLGMMYTMIEGAASDMRNMADLLKEEATVKDKVDAKILKLLPPPPPTSSSSSSSSPPPRIEFRNVTFRYQTASNYIDTQMANLRGNAAAATATTTMTTFSALRARINRVVRSAFGYESFVDTTNEMEPRQGRGNDLSEWDASAISTTTTTTTTVEPTAVVVNIATPASAPPRTVLSNISFSVPAGSTLAVVGTTGSGKSTIARLLLRFADPTEGQVLIDGQVLTDVFQSSLRGAVIGYVPQDIALFNESLRFNIAYARPDATDDEVIAAATAAQLAPFLSRCPEGLGTRVGERGLKLSGGEKQRVALARALLANPPILVLDEATSALDSTTEAAVQTAISAERKGRTTVVVAHRLSTVRDADQILVLEDGVIVEIGCHTVLLEKGGRYAELWHRQAIEEVPRLTTHNTSATGSGGGSGGSVVGVGVVSKEE